MSLFRRLAEFQTGRLILMNFWHGLNSGHFDRSERLKALARCWDRHVRDRAGNPAGASLPEILSGLHTAYQATIAGGPLSHISFPIPDPQLGRLNRVMTVQFLALDEIWSLIDARALLRLPAILQADWADNPHHHRRIVALNGRAEAIRHVTGPDGSRTPILVRGPLPFAWVTGEGMLTDWMAAATHRAEAARDGLGLPYPRGTHLYRLSYPTSGMACRAAGRPTFAEANGNPYFRSRRDTRGDLFGRTTDLRKAAAGAAEVEGLPEVIVDAEPMSAAFAWEYLGRVESDLPDVDFRSFELTLIDGGDADHACDCAVAELDGLVS